MATKITDSTIRTAEVRAGPLTLIHQRVTAAHAAGIDSIAINNGRPIFHIGSEESLPPRWHGSDIGHVPHVDLKRGKVTLLGLNAERRPFLITQRKGPSVAIWPIEEDYVRPPELAAQDRLDTLERSVRRLRREIKELRKILNTVGTLMVNFTDVKSAKNPSENPEDP